jgi:hypothetical protein
MVLKIILKKAQVLITILIKCYTSKLRWKHRNGHGENSWVWEQRVDNGENPQPSS